MTSQLTAQQLLQQYGERQQSLGADVINTPSSYSAGLAMPPAVYEFEFGGMGKGSGPLAGKWGLDAVREAFTAHGFADYAPRKREPRTTHRRTLAGLTHVDPHRVQILDDLLVVPESERITATDEVGADLQVTALGRVRMDKATGTVAVSSHLAPVYDRALAREEELLTGEDITHSFSKICKAELGGVLKRSAEYFVPNDAAEADAHYEPAMRRLAVLVRTLGGRCSIIPIYDEEGLFSYVAERAADALAQEFETLRKGAELLLVRAKDGHKPRNAKQTLQDDFSALMAKAKWFNLRFAAETKRLQTVLDTESEKVFSEIMRVIAL